MNSIHRNYIAGEWREPGDAKVNENPSDLDTPVGTYAQGTAEDVTDAVTAARAAAPAWAATTPTQRATALAGVAAELKARSDELGRLLASEEGKTLAEAVGEVNRAADIFTFFAGEVFSATSCTIKVTFMLTRYSVILPALTTTFCSWIQAPCT